MGWDYAHYGDYAGYEDKLPIGLRTEGKRWTTEEIFKDVKEVCYQVQNRKGRIIINKLIKSVKKLDNKLNKESEK